MAQENSIDNTVDDAAADVAATPDESAATDVSATDAPATADGGAEKNSLLRQLSYTFPIEQINRDVDAALAMQAKKTNLKGFRPGKVSLSVMRRRFGKDVLRDVLTQAAFARFQEEVAEAAGERIAATPDIRPEPLADAEQYTVHCAYEVLPSIALPKFDSLTLSVPVLPIGETEIDEMIEVLREQNGEYVAAADAAKFGDRLTVNFKTFQPDKDEVMESGENRQMRLGTKAMHREINEGLLGAVAEDCRHINVEQPQTHPDEKLRGKTMRMEITVLAVERLQKPALDENFYATLGVEAEGGMPAFRKAINDYLQHEVNVRLRNLLQQRTMNKLLEATPPFSLPVSHVRRECFDAYKRAQEERKGKADASLRPEMFMLEAQRRVALGLVLSDWQQREKPEISDAERDARLDEIVSVYENPQQAKTQILADKQQMEIIRLSILEDRIADWVRSQIECKEEPLSLSQLLDYELLGGGETEGAAHG